MLEKLLDGFRASNGFTYKNKFVYGICELMENFEAWRGANFCEDKNAGFYAWKNVESYLMRVGWKRIR